MIYKKRVVIVNDNDLSNDINSAQSAAGSAVLEQHRIYYRSKVGITPHGAALPEVWINNTGDIYNETATVNAANAWTTKITPIARSTDDNEETDKYLFLYTCIQKRTVLGDITYTDILLDETTTVIDGGNIITGSITANRLNARDINASNTLSIGAFDAETREAVSNSTYITYIDGNGIWITPSGSKPTNTQTGAGATGTKIDGTGIGIYLNGTKLAQYGITTSLYESNGTLAAQLNTEGLVLKKGGIKGGEVGENGFVYLSTEDYPRYGELIDSNISNGLSINGHNPSIAQYTTSGTDDPAWREVIGTKFGVDAEGNLYASNAEISGKITASSLTIGSGATVSGLSTLNISGIDSYALQNSLDTEVAQRKAVYAISTTGATTAAKTTESGTPAGFVLYSGATVTVKFNNANSTTTPTLNVNGTGAKTIKSYTGAALTAAEYTWPAGAAITFTYDGSYWRMQDGGALQAKADAQEAVDWTASISVTAINYTANSGNGSATLSVAVFKGGSLQSSGFTRQWYKNSTALSNQTGATLSVTDLNASYTCIIS